MGRTILLPLGITFFGILLFVNVANTYTAMDAVVFSVAVCLVICALAALLRGQSGPNPFLVYGMLMGLAGVWMLGAMAVAWIGPGGTLLIVVAMVPLAVLITLANRRRAIRQRRIETGLCGQCGYDLRASEERCPECGSAIPEELLRRRRIAAELAAAKRQPAAPGEPRAS